MSANGVISSPERVLCGVPQGSVLGPLFFQIYLDDIMSCVTDVGVSLYADDTVLFVDGENLEYCRVRLKQ